MKCILHILSLLMAFCAVGNQYYVAPNGSPSNDGSVFSPWDLQTALNHPAMVAPGDVIWLRGGVYTGYFTSELNGTTNTYITVAQYPTERATLADNRQFASGATLQVNGSWTIFKGFEVCNTHPDRTSSGSASFRPMGLQVEGHHIKCVNLVIHDTGHGIGFWDTATDSELYGCLIYNCGTKNSPGVYSTHGHGIYSQNNTGLKVIRNNIVFNQFGFGIHVYPNPGNINNYLLDQNVLFQNGILTDDSVRYSNLLVNSYPPFTCENVEISGNHTYDERPEYTYNSLYQADVFVGATDVVCQSLKVSDNHFNGNQRAGLALLNWDTITYSSNQTYYGNHGSAAVFLPPGITYADYHWEDNTYYTPGSTEQFSVQGGPLMNFNDWQSTTGFDAASQFSSTPPSSNEVFVFPNTYDLGRAHIVVYNRDELAAVPVDLSNSGLSHEMVYSIVDVQNYFGTPVYSGLYNENNPVIALPMNHSTIQSPVGWTSPEHTTHKFGVFVVLMDIPATLDEQLQNGTIFHFYPNPVQETAHIDFDLLKESTVRLTLYRTDGSLILEKEWSKLLPGYYSEKLSLSELNEGVYLIRIETDDSVYALNLVKTN